jgi:hypothetical protein
MYIIVITHTYLYDWERDRQRSRSITLTPFHNKISTMPQLIIEQRVEVIITLGSYHQLCGCETPA